MKLRATSVLVNKHTKGEGLKMTKIGTKVQAMLDDRSSMKSIKLNLRDFGSGSTYYIARKNAPIPQGYETDFFVCLGGPMRKDFIVELLVESNGDPINYPTSGGTGRRITALSK